MASASLPAGDASFRQLLSFVRLHSKAILERFAPDDFCLAILDEQDGTGLVAEARALAASLDADVQDYAISSAYARLIGDTRRKALSAYFTPPGLASATLAAIGELVDLSAPLRILDPACGGGSFLVPTARLLIERRIAKGQTPGKASRAVIGQLRGVEIDPGLARISAGLLKRMIRREWEQDVDTGNLVLCANALTAKLPATFDVAIGNPPYSKVWRAGASRKYGSVHPERLGSMKTGGNGADGKLHARNSNSFSTMQRRALHAFVEGLTTSRPCPLGTVPASYRACRSTRPCETQRNPVRPAGVRSISLGDRRSYAPSVVARWWLGGG